FHVTGVQTCALPIWRTLALEPCPFTRSTRKACPNCGLSTCTERPMATRKQEIEHLAKLMNKIDIAMLATVARGGQLVSRPLSTQCATFDGERVWFLSEADTSKVGEILRHPKVNVAYASK